MLQKRNDTEKAGVELRNSEREKTLRREQIGGELARLTERKEVMLREYDEVIRKLYDEYSLTRSEAEKVATEPENPTEAKKTLVEVKGKIRGLGNVNVSAIEEYKEVKERYDFLNEQIEDVENSRKEKLVTQSNFFKKRHNVITPYTEKSKKKNKEIKELYKLLQS